MDNTKDRATRGVLKCYQNGAQYNLVAENGIFRVYSDFGRVLFEILTNDESAAVQSFRDFFGKNATYERFYLGFGD